MISLIHKCNGNITNDSSTPLPTLQILTGCARYLTAKKGNNTTELEEEPNGPKSRAHLLILEIAKIN